MKSWVFQIICFTQCVWNNGLRRRLYIWKHRYTFWKSLTLASSIFEVFLRGWPSCSLGKGPRTELDNCRVGLSDIMSLTKIDILFHPPPNPLHAQISASPSLEISLSSTCIIRHRAFRADAGWNWGWGGCLFKRTTNIYCWHFQGLFNVVKGVGADWIWW